jgi:hypothetical protein
LVTGYDQHDRHRVDEKPPGHTGDNPAWRTPCRDDTLSGLVDAVRFAGVEFNGTGAMCGRAVPC